MRQVYMNQFEKVGSNDINDLQLAAMQSVFDDYLHANYGASGVIPYGLAGSYVGALATQVAPGTGFFYDAAQVGLNPKYRMILVGANVPVVHTAADPANDRIDLVCISPNYAVTSTANRFVKTGGVGPIILTNVNKIYSDSYTITVVAGVPAGVPVAPALPAGSIALYLARVTAATGIANGAALTDVRTFLYGSQAPALRALSGSSGLFVTASNIDVAVTNLFINWSPAYLRSVQLSLVPDGGASPAFIGGSKGAGLDVDAIFSLYRGVTLIASVQVTTAGAAGYSNVPPGGFSFIDTPPAGVNAYNVQARVGITSNGNANVARVKLQALQI